jgi:NADH-quinone oxidoreductase subunit M
VLAPLLGLIVFLGIYPKPVLDRMTPSIDRLIVHVEDNSDFVSPERPEQPVLASTGEGGEGDDQAAESGK